MNVQNKRHLTLLKQITENIFIFFFVHETTKHLKWSLKVVIFIYSQQKDISEQAREKKYISIIKFSFIHHAEN